MAVYGVLAAILAMNNYLPSGVWLPYVILGAIFSLAGIFLWSKRPKGATA